MAMLALTAAGVLAAIAVSAAVGWKLKPEPSRGVARFARLEP
jgi:hypothetical protein